MDGGAGQAPALPQNPGATPTGCREDRLLFGSAFRKVDCRRFSLAAEFYLDRWTKKRNGLSQIRWGTNCLIAASNSFCLKGLRNVRWGPSTLAALTEHPSNFLEPRIQFRQTKLQHG